MKKYFAVPLAAVLAVACSEPSAPTASSDLAPSYAKPVAPASEATGTAYTDFYDFNTISVAAAAHSNIGTDVSSGIGASAATIQSVPSNPSDGFIGRFENLDTRALLAVTTAGSKYTVNFDLYVIGSWDGNGKQAQSGDFGANLFQIGYRCGSSAVVPIFTTTFSNQYTVQQDFPLAAGLGGSKAGTGASAVDALGYATHPELSNTPEFRSFGDATYNLTYTVGNVCGGVAPTFVFSTSIPGEPGLQSLYDESWGIDNLTLKVDN